MNNIKINSLDFFEVRSAEVPPLHFEYVYIPMRYNLEQTIFNWIKQHLKGRFYVGKSVYVDSTNKMIDGLKIGFEQPKELSFFTLACPHLKYK